MVWVLQYFTMVLSMFPRCSVSSIYASPTWKDAATQFIQELIEVQVEMVTTSYVSLLAFTAMVVTLIVFADCTSVTKKCVTGVLISCLHCLAAFTILLVFECILEIATVRGTLGREGSNSLYNYFSSTLPDFSRLAPFDVFNLAHLFAEFMKLCMTIFDGTCLYPTAIDCAPRGAPMSQSNGYICSQYVFSAGSDCDPPYQGTDVAERVQYGDLSTNPNHKC